MRAKRQIWDITQKGLGAPWHMNLQQQYEGQEADMGHYPERPGEPDCTYYMRTGGCGYGMSCRFNHPPNRKQAASASRTRGEYPERIGQPECQYYMKTGTCKFGVTCKFHHPRDKAGTAGRTTLNVLGYPLRPNEKDCQYYMRTTQCKYGATCKFNHPQPGGTLVPMRGTSLYTTVHSPTTPGPQPYPGGLHTWPPMARAHLIQSPRWQGPSSYASVILPQGLVSVPSWSTYPQGQVGSISSPDGQQQTIGAGLVYGPTPQADPVVGGIQGTFSPYPPGSPGMGPPTLQLPSSSTQGGSMFPERPGQAECQFYMKTGDCKFGMTCRYHHPKDRTMPTPNCILNPMGLPIRPGAPACTFFSRYGICKFGPTCKFDHPMNYTQSISAPIEIPISRPQIGSSSSALASASLELPVESTHQQSSGGDDLGADS
uniref:C3H1-type domain-containing protein n=1 Tax=Araucaria cunninghamii TaxID=56994 RepID=A0A0D6R1T0_ARACU